MPNPGGGGAYAVSRANLGAGFSLVAGAALIVDYTLTVSVSIAAGVGALTSAFPSLTSATSDLSGDSGGHHGVEFARPGRERPRVSPPHNVVHRRPVGGHCRWSHPPLGSKSRCPADRLLQTHGLQVVSVLLILEGFFRWLQRADGCGGDRQRRTALSRARVKRAKRTEMMLGLILGAMLLGLAVLARRWHIGPRSNQTVLSQIMGWRWDVTGRTTSCP